MTACTNYVSIEKLTEITNKINSMTVDFNNTINKIDKLSLDIGYFVNVVKETNIIYCPIWIKYRNEFANLRSIQCKLVFNFKTLHRHFSSHIAYYDKKTKENNINNMKILSDLSNDLVCDFSILNKKLSELTSVVCNLGKRKDYTKIIKEDTNFYNFLIELYRFKQDIKNVNGTIKDLNNKKIELEITFSNFGFFSN